METGKMETEKLETEKIENRKLEIGKMEMEKLEKRKLETGKFPFRRKVITFGDLNVYQLAREFRNKRYHIVKTLPEKESYNLAGQMRRAAVSLTNNIAEGYGRFHYQENIQFCRQARGSLNELIDDLNICIDQSYGAEDDCRLLKEEAFHILKVLNGYIAATRRMQKAEAGGN